MVQAHGQGRIAGQKCRRGCCRRGIMKAVLVLTVLAGLLAAAPVRADDPPACEVPAYLLTSESALGKVGAAVKPGGKLNILVVGSRSSVIGVSDTSSAYPGRLQAVLRDRLPSVEVNVSLELQLKKTAEEMVPALATLVRDKKPDLVIWQTGTVDAMRAVDADDFRSAIDEGVAAMKSAGADVLLMNLQYSPRTETMISASAYIDNMRVVAQQHDVPLFDRFAIMRHWNEAGDFDLFSPSPGVELARRVHDCLARALATFVIDDSALMSYRVSLSRLVVLTGLAAAFILPLQSLPLRAEPDVAGASSSPGPKAAAPACNGVAAADASADKKSLPSRAIDKVKEVAKTAGDIFARVPCLPPKGGAKAMGTLPHVAAKLAAGQPVVIVAFGSSSTEGYGSTGPEFTYPNRLAAQLRRAYPDEGITVLNRGKGGEDAPEMIARLQSEVINSKPDLVIWQVGTNAVLRNLDPGETAKIVEDGISRIQEAGADLVLVDPQYSPAVN
eukprot:gene34748-46660_t